MIYRTLNQFTVPVIIVTTGLMVFCSCSKCKEKPIITSFAFEELSPVATGIIDQSVHTIAVVVPGSTDVSDLTPTIRVGTPDCMTLSPRSGIGQDFSSPMVYRVSNEVDEVVSYTVSVNLKPSSTGQEDSIRISWTGGADIPVALGWSAASVADEKIFVTGGLNTEDGVTRHLQIYDPELDKWTLKENHLQTRRWGHSSTMVDGKIYIMGGADEAPRDTTPVTSIDVYDPASDSWSTIGEMTRARIGHGAVGYHGKIYIMGGEYKEPDLTTLNTMEVYDPSTNSWETLSPMTTSRIFMATCVVGDTIYVLGGGSKYPYSGLKSVEAYIIPEDRWEVKADLKVGLGDLDACVIDNQIYCEGGWAIWGDIGNTTVQVFDPLKNYTFRANSLQFPRGATATVNYGERIYVVGGFIALNPEALFSNKTEIGAPGN